MLIAIPYIILVSFLGIFGLLYEFSNENQRRKLVYTSVVIFWIFFAFRGYILGDWVGYYKMFQNISPESIINLNAKTDEKIVEPGFLALMYIIKCIYNNFMFFTFVCATINTILFAVFLRRSVDNIPFALMLYVSYGGLVLSTDLMRNSLALFIILNAMGFLQKRQIVPYMILCSIATLFHFSSILFFPLYFVFYRAFPKYIFLTVLIVLFPLRFAHISFIEVVAKIFHLDEYFQLMYHAYVEVMNGASGTIVTAIVYLIIGFLVFCYYDRLKCLNPMSIIVVNALIVYIILWMLFGEFAELCKRLTVLFGFGMWITPCYLIKCFNIEHNRRLFIAFIMLLCIRIAFGFNQTDFEYDNILFGAKTYEQRLIIHEKYTDKN